LIESHKEFLICTNCSNSLKLNIFERFENSERIKEGLLKCTCGMWFPIINGVPRLLQGRLRNLFYKHHKYFIKKYRDKLGNSDSFESDIIQERTAYIHDIDIKKPSEKFKNFDQSFKDWISPISPAFFKEKIILDVGCRIGINSYFSGKFGAKFVIGIDIGETVETAYEVNCELENVLIVQADLNNIPTKQIFDFIFSIGVLHHIPNPKLGMTKLIEKAKSGSKVLVWIYGYENYYNLKMILFLRKLTVNSNVNVVKTISLIYALFFFLQVKHHNSLLKKGKIKPNLWLKYLNSFRFKEIEAYVFNQLAPPIAFYFTKKEFEEFCNIEGIKNLKVINMFDNSWKGIMELD